MKKRSISPEQTIEVLSGSRDIPADITMSVEAMLDEEKPLVDIDRFGAFVTGLMIEKPRSRNEVIDAHFRSIVTLGSCSIEMAWQQAGDVYIPRPRRLHEHNQSVLNTYSQFFADEFTDPRDRVLWLAFALQDSGKPHSAALALLANPQDRRPSRNQAVHNYRFAHNLLRHLPNEILSPDEKTVDLLLIQETAIGTALYKHSEKNVPIEEVVAEAEAKLNQLRAQCPADYRDRFDDYLLACYHSDAGAHTQRAQYKDAATGEIRPDVLHEDRFNPDGSETMKTLDRIFSEAPEDMTTLKLFQPKHLAVMRRLFPNHYE